MHDRALNRAPLEDCPELAKFGRFGVLGRLGRGGMSLVYLARDVGEDGATRHFALKTLLPERLHDPEARARFAEEARVNAALRSEHTCRLFEHGAHGEHPYLATEYVWGPSLAELLSRASARRRPLDWRVVVEVVRRVALALEHIHSEAAGEDGVPLRLVHADVAPDNILLRWDGGVRLIDLGVASTQSHLNAAVGKYPYLSPEMVTSQPLDARSDLFSLGAVLYEALTGEPPFERASLFLTMQAILSEPTPSVQTARPELPAALDGVLARVMAKSLDERYASARALAEALDALLRSTGAAPTESAIAQTLGAYFVNDEDRNPLQPGSDQMMIDGTGLEPTALAEALRPAIDEGDGTAAWGDHEGDDEATVIGGRDILALLRASQAAAPVAVAPAKSFARPQEDAAPRPRPEALGAVPIGSLEGLAFPPHFEPVAELAPHALGRSFHAIDRKAGRDVLVHSLDASWADAVRVLERRRTAIAAIVHPNVWPVPEVMRVHGDVLVAGPLPRGPSLHGLMQRGLRLSHEATAELLAPVAAGLDRAHAAGLPHLLVNASYVFFDRSTEGVRPVLAGFGFGALHRAASHGAPAQRWPKDELACLSPEALDDIEPGPAADVFSLAVLALRLMDAPLPFESTSELSFSLQSKASMTALLDAPDWGPASVDGQLRWVLAHALAAGPGQRYQSCGGWVADLRRACRGEAIDGVASRARAVGFTLTAELGQWCLEPPPARPDLRRPRAFVLDGGGFTGEGVEAATAIDLERVDLFGIGARLDSEPPPAPPIGGQIAVRPATATRHGMPAHAPPPAAQHPPPPAQRAPAATLPSGSATVRNAPIPPTLSPAPVAPEVAATNTPRPPNNASPTQAPLHSASPPTRAPLDAPPRRSVRGARIAILVLLVLTAFTIGGFIAAGYEGWPPAVRVMQAVGEHFEEE